MLVSPYQTGFVPGRNIHVKENGGLGLRRLEAMNNACIRVADSSLWKAIVSGWNQLLKSSFWSIRNGNTGAE
jgi:hypothetical protein